MKNTIFDFEKLTESVRKDGRRHDYKIEKMLVYNNFLYYKRKYVDNPNFDWIEYFLFPLENIGIYKLYLSKNPKLDLSYLYKYYVDMVSVSKEEDKWIVKDLYLDFIIKADGRYYVVDVDEFNEAIDRKELHSEDIGAGLNGLNKVLCGYYKSFDMEAFISELKESYIKDSELIYDKCNA